TNRHDRSTDAHPAHPRAPPKSTAPPPASRAPAISRAATATRLPATCSAGDRIELPSFLGFVAVPHQPIEQANAVARCPALVDLRLRRPHRGPCNIEMRPWRIVDEALQELCSRDRSAVTHAGVLHVRELRIDQLVVFGPERHAP